MTKHVCKISHLNYKRLLRKLQKMLGGYFILPHPVETGTFRSRLIGQYLTCQTRNVTLERRPLTLEVTALVADAGLRALSVYQV